MSRLARPPSSTPPAPRIRALSWVLPEVRHHTPEQRCSRPAPLWGAPFACGSHWLACVADPSPEYARRLACHPSPVAARFRRPIESPLGYSCLTKGTCDDKREGVVRRVTRSPDAGRWFRGGNDNASSG